jgi:hypothetical protein
MSTMRHTIQLDEQEIQLSLLINMFGGKMNVIYIYDI